MNRSLKLIYNINRLLEARSHPELNKKLPPSEVIMNALTKYYELDLKSDYPLYFISFKGEHNKDMLMLNPKYAYSTPNGIYSYPIRYFYDKRDNNLFASKAPYIYILKRNSDKVIYTDLYNEQDYKRDISRFSNYYDTQEHYNPTQLFSEKDVISYIPSISQIEKFVEEGFTNKYSENKLKRKPTWADRIWRVTKTAAEHLTPEFTSVSNKWNLILSNVLGYDAVIDMGIGMIGSLLDTQAVFFKTSAYKIEDRINNINEYKKIYINGKLYSLNNIVIEGETVVVRVEDDMLDLRSSVINKLPDKLIVKGSLSLSGAIINDIGDLIVEDKLYLRNTKLFKMPRSIEAEYLEICGIDKLPENIKVRDDLHIVNAKIRVLPDSLQVDGNIYAPVTLKIENVPEHLRDKIIIDV